MDEERTDVAVRVPLDYRGQLGLDFGRRARPGEQYDSVAESAQAPGELLHCVEVEGRRVRDVLAVLDRRKVYAIWRDPDDRTVPVGEVLDRWIKASAPWAPGQVLFFTDEDQPDPPLPARTAGTAEAVGVDTVSGVGGRRLGCRR